MVDVGPHRSQQVRASVKEISAVTQIQRLFKMRKAAREAAVSRGRTTLGNRLSEEMTNFEMQQVEYDAYEEL